jgi:hypothetical protein
MIRSSSWKLIHYYEDGHDELYNLDTDPGEQTDVIAESGEKAQELRKRLDRWLVEVDAKLPNPDPEYDPDKEKARIRSLEYELMPKLEAEHAEYLDPGWQPNEDWWGSQVTND